MRIFDQYVETVKENGMETKIIDGDALESDGAIIFDGNVVVTGKIASNAVIEASGDVITPCIEFAQVYCKGTFYADLITGAGDEKYAIVRAKEGVVADVIQYANVISYENIDVVKSVEHSDMFAESVVTVTNKDGYIAGGRVSGYAGVNCGSFGNAEGLETKIIAGYSRRLVAELESGKKSIEELDSKKKNVKQYLDKLQKGNNPGKLKELEGLYQEVLEEHRKITAKVASIEETLKMDQMPEVNFNETVYNGVQVAIGKSAMFMDVPFKGPGKLYLDGKEIKIEKR